MGSGSVCVDGTVVQLQYLGCDGVQQGTMLGWLLCCGKKGSEAVWTKEVQVSEHLASGRPTKQKNSHSHEGAQN